TSDGVVQHRGALGGLGNAVVLAHANGFTTRYGHLSRFAAGVRTGSRVSQGEVIGYVGMTGLATGPHLHYEMIRSGRHVDPLAVDLPNGDPVPTEAIDRWSAELTPRVALLESVPMAGGARYVDSDTDAPDDAPGDETDDDRP
ncbi:MAG: M23 family metallopeptidase, partial [Gemmatimonadetes bacterium]|nr:M23 family metallopeptidase [Gemmatimonadota bacterium]